jgi:hypothetical protein
MPQYIDEKFPTSGNFVKSRVENLNKVYMKINGMNKEAPHDLAKMVTLYSVAQGIIGELYAQSVYDAKIAYNERKEAQAAAELGYQGTGKEKESYGTIATSELRKIEARAEAEKEKWEKAFHATENLSNALKHELKVVFYDYGNGGKPS